MNQVMADWDQFSDTIRFLRRWLQDSLLPHCFLQFGGVASYSTVFTSHVAAQWFRRGAPHFLSFPASWPAEVVLPPPCEERREALPENFSPKQ